MKCSPKIWRKFSPLEKLIWKDMYEAFIFEVNFPPEWMRTEDKKKREVVAHNLACEAVWTLQLYLQDFIKNHASS